jgi:DNA-binding transcriptional regulator YdaS (Cro superfamily)
MIHSKMTVLQKYLDESETSRAALAKAAGISESLVGHWCNGLRLVPPEQAIRLAKLTKWRLTPHQLRPDIWPNATDALPRKAA